MTALGNIPLTTNVPTTAEMDAAVAAIIASSDAMVFKGVIDCSSNPNYPAADRGHTYRVSVAGKIGGASGPNVEAGDLLLCLTDGTAAGTQAAVGANWSIAQTNVDGAYFQGGTDVAVADGGTGASTAAAARTNLGLVIDTDVAAKSTFDAHLADASDAHDASAISIADAGNDFTATDVEGALAELASAPGGSAWDLVLDLPLSSLTGWTINNGAWAINGGVLENTTGPGRLVYDTLIPLTEYLVEADLWLGAGAYVGFGSQTNGDNIHSVVRLSDEDNVYVQTYSGLVATFPVPGGVSPDVWRKLRVHYVGSYVAAWVDGVFVGSTNGPIHDNRLQKFQLATHNPGVTNKYRNLKLWTPTLPA